MFSLYLCVCREYIKAGEVMILLHHIYSVIIEFVIFYHFRLFFFLLCPLPSCVPPRVFSRFSVPSHFVPSHADTLSFLYVFSFSSADHAFLTQCAAESADKAESGAVGAVVILEGDKLHVANVGDVTAVLSRGGQDMVLTTLHKLTK